MVVKITYGHPHTVTTGTAVANGRVQLNFQDCQLFPSDALLLMNSHTILDNRDVVIQKIVSTNGELVELIKVLQQIKFVRLHDEIDVYEFIAESDTTHEQLNVEYVVRLTKHDNIYPYSYRLEGESAIAKIRNERNKIIKSKSWNIGGEITTDDDDIIAIKRQKPVEFIELSAILNDVCPNITRDEQTTIMRDCVKTRVDTVFGEDSWRDFSWFEIRMFDLEQKLQELGRLKPYLRKVRVGQILDTL